MRLGDYFKQLDSPLTLEGKSDTGTKRTRQLLGQILALPLIAVRLLAAWLLIIFVRHVG